MIFINKNADFSENNVGQVNIPIDLDSTASAILSKYTKSLTDEKKIAFSQLISGLKSAGIYDKIEFLYLPCLAGTVSEAFYDVIKDTTQDLSNTATYGQYSLNANGLLTTYDSSKTYTAFGMILERTTYASTIVSIAHPSLAGSGAYMNWAWTISNMGQALKKMATDAKVCSTAYSGNNTVELTASENVGSIVHIVSSYIDEANSWLPSASNFINRLNGASVTFSSNIGTSISVSKTANFFLGSYSSYGSSFCTNYGSIDFVAICPNLESTVCINDSNKTMAVRFGELVGAFKTAFFAA